MRRRESGPLDLEALDPTTGESLSGRRPSAVEVAAARRTPKVRRLRRIALVLAMLAVASGLGGAYFGATIVSLRGIERSWRQAMAVDRARAEVDGQILGLLRAAGDPEDDAGRGPIGQVGQEAAAALSRYEAELEDRRIADSKISDLRDEMVKALTFRRFQMSPERLQLGDTPLRKIERALAAQLDRWDLDPITVPTPTLRTAAPALATLRRFADKPTETTLMALAGRQLVTIDIDDDSIEVRPLPAEPAALVALGELAVTVGPDGVTAYPPDPSEPARWQRAGMTAVPSARGTIAVLADGVVVDVAADGRDATGPVAMPPGRRLVAAIPDGYILEAPDAPLQLLRPDGQTTNLSAIGAARFLGARDDVIAFQTGVADRIRFADPTGVELSSQPLPRTDVVSAVFRPGHTEAALVVGPLAGRLASVFLVNPPSPGLASLEGPRAMAKPGAIAWSADGRWLFWLTPEGRVVVREDDRIGANLLRTRLDGLRAIVAVASQR